MVGESKDCSILKMRQESITSDSGKETGSYSRRKKEKKTTKFQSEVNGFDDIEHCVLVDKFVQDVIERAKEEYLREYGGPEVGTAADDNSSFRQDAAVTSPSTPDRLLKETKDKESGNKSKHKRKHHYKYSGKVDEKEISEYETQEDNSLLTENPTVDTGEVTPPHQSFYRRSAATVRQLITCCFGKT